MKKVFSILISIIIVCLSFGIVAANATEAISNNLYVLSEACPEDAISYAKEVFSSFPKEEAVINSKIELGHPFSLSNDDENITMYYFPVTINDKIIYTYRVYNLNGWKYVLSQALADELNKAIPDSTETYPVVIYLNEDSDIVVQNKKITEVFEDGPRDDYNNISILNENGNRTKQYDDIIVGYKDTKSSVVVNCSLVISDQFVNNNTTADYVTGNTIAKAASKYDSYCANFILPTINEDQDTDSWCAGYVIAFIASYKNNTTYYARNVAAYAGVEDTTDDISVSKCVKYAKAKGLSNTRRTWFDVSDIGMMEQIDADCPVFVGAYTGLIGAGHAFAVCGYSWSGTEIMKWSIWNPWYTYLEYIDSSREYIAANGQHFKAWETFVVDIY